MKFPRCNNGTAMQTYTPCWTDTKGKVMTFLDESTLWMKPGFAHTNQTWKANQINEKHAGSDRPKKVLSIVAYDIHGIILHHAVPLRPIVNTEYYCTFLQHHLRPSLRRKGRNMVVPNPNILHDNARSRTHVVATDLLRRWQWDILEHPPYSPELSPCDYELFAKVKEPLRGTRYKTTDELIRAIGRSIRNIEKDGGADGVRRLPNIWQTVINKGRDYTLGT